MKYTLGERLNFYFNRKIKLEFQGARLTSRNIQHDMTSLLRQSVYSRFAGYEDVNDAQRLSLDPVMRAVTGKRKNAASVNTIGRFLTEILCFVLTSTVTVRERCFVQAMSTVLICYFPDGRGCHKNGIMVIQCHKVNMGNIYFCSNRYISCTRMDI